MLHGTLVMCRCLRHLLCEVPHQSTAHVQLLPLQAVPWELSLAALRKFIWRQKEKEIVVEYRIADPANPAPLPTIERQP
jgi:hypothetical protein